MKPSDQMTIAGIPVRTGYYILDDAGEPRRTYDAVEWATWMERAHTLGLRRVAQDLDEGDPGKEIRVSTVFLGLDHGFGGRRELFETMVFVNGVGEDAERLQLRRHRRDVRRQEAANRETG